MPPYILSRKMAEGQMLKKLPEECLLNISSFMLGTPQQMKFKNSKGLKQIQKKYKLDKKNFTEHECIRYDEDDETYRELTYGYFIRNRNYAIEETISIIKRQCHKLKSMVKPDGDTDLLIHFNYYVRHIHTEEHFYDVRIEDIDYTDSEEELLGYISRFTDRVEGHFQNNFIYSEIQFKSVYFHLINRNWNTDN